MTYPTMQLTGEDIVNAHAALTRIGDFAFTPEHFKLADRFARAQRKVGKVANRIEKLRQKLVRQYAVFTESGDFETIKDAAGNPVDVKIDPKRSDEYREKVDALMDAEYEVEAAPFTVAEVEGIKATFKPSTLAALGPLYEGNN